MPVVRAGQSEREYGWVDLTPCPVVITDDNGRPLALNSAFESLFGLTQSGLASEPLEDRVLPSRLRAAYRAARRLALAGEASAAGGRWREFVAVHPDRGEFAVELRVARTDEDPPQVVTWMRDVTEERTNVARRGDEFSAPALTHRELEVLQLSATGHVRRQVAQALGVSEATVKTHLEHIYRKLGVPDRASAVAMGLRQGFIH